MAGLPKAFIDHYTSVLGEENAKIFFEYCKKPLRKSFRINTLKTTKEIFFTSYIPADWEISEVEWCNTGFFLERSDTSVPVGHLPEHFMGLLYIQEASSMIPVEALFWGHENKDFSNCIVGDIAASPGSKTTHIACKLQGKGTIVANEISSSRLKSLYSNIERCGISNVILTHYDGENLCSCLPETFDFLLLDAPCTGEGTVRKNFDALKNWSKSDAITMSYLQKKLLRSAFESLKEGGELVYSTCTLGVEENQNVVEYLLSIYPENVEIIPLIGFFKGSEKSITKEGFLHVFPHTYNTEGFFIAKIKKTKSLQDKSHIPPLKKFPFTLVSSKEKEAIKNVLLEHWGWEISDDIINNLWKRENEIWLLPRHINMIASRVRANRAGVHLGTWYNEQWKTTHECISCFGEYFTAHVRNIEKEDLKKIITGNNLYDQEEGLKGEYCLRHKNIPIALGKMQNGVWKNNIPRTLIL